MIKIFAQVVSENRGKTKQELRIFSPDLKSHGLVWCETDLAIELKRRIEGGNAK